MDWNFLKPWTCCYTFFHSLFFLFFLNIFLVCAMNRKLVKSKKLKKFKRACKTSFTPHTHTYIHIHMSIVMRIQRWRAERTSNFTWKQNISAAEGRSMKKKKKTPANQRTSKPSNQWGTTSLNCSNECMAKTKDCSKMYNACRDICTYVHTHTRRHIYTCNSVHVLQLCIFNCRQ